MQLERINSYIKTNPRNKIIIYYEEVQFSNVVDVGKTFARILQNIKVNKHFALKAKDKLYQFLTNTIINHSDFGEVIAIKNLGILFEKELNIDFIKLVDDFSKNNCLFINWEGDYEHGKLYFLNKNSGIEINIEHLSHIKL